MHDCRPLAGGHGRGKAIVLDEPLSFWGGVDTSGGEIIDHHHPQRGETVSGRVVVMPGGRGSSSSSSVFAEAVRRGSAPAAVVLREPDPIVALGAIVARELYGLAVPVVVVDNDTYARLSTGDTVTVDGDEATIEVVNPPESEPHCA